MNTEKLFPNGQNKAWEVFMSAPPIEDDVSEAIFEARQNDFQLDSPPVGENIADDSDVDSTAERILNKHIKAFDKLKNFKSE